MREGDDHPPACLSLKRIFPADEKSVTRVLILRRVPDPTPARPTINQGWPRAAPAPDRRAVPWPRPRLGKQVAASPFPKSSARRPLYDTSAATGARHVRHLQRRSCRACGSLNENISNIELTRC
jgi:hypothetical protein